MIRKLTGQKAVCAALALIMSASMFQVFAADDQGPVKVRFEDLEKIVRTQSPAYLIAAENFGVTQDGLQSAMDAIPQADAKYYETTLALEEYYARLRNEEAKDEGDRDYYKISVLRLDIEAAERALASYQATISSAYRTILTESDDNDAKERELRTTLTSATTSAKQLFIGLKAIDEGLKVARLSHETLNSKLPGMNVKYSLGLVSKTQLNDFLDGIESAKTAISDLEVKRRSTEINLKLFLGIKLADAIELDEMPEMDLEKIKTLAYAADKEKFIGNSQTIINDKKRVVDVEPGKIAHTNAGYAIAKINLDRDTENVIATFENDYQALKDGYRDYLKKLDDIVKMEKELSDLEVKFERGIASRRELEDKKSDIQRTKLETGSSRLDLCSKLVTYQDRLAGIWK